MILIGFIAVFLISLFIVWEFLTTFLPRLILIWIFISVICFLFSWTFLVILLFALSAGCFYIVYQQLKNKKK